MAQSHESVFAFQNQLASIMDVLVRNAICEITKLFETRLSEFQSMNVTQNEKENATPKQELQQNKVPSEMNEEYRTNRGGKTTDLDTWDEQLCTGTIDVFGQFVSNNNENVTKTLPGLTLSEKQGNDDTTMEHDLDQRWSGEMWRDGMTHGCGAGITEAQTIQVKQEMPEVEHTDVYCSACGKVPVLSGSLCTTCTAFNHQGAQIDSQPSSLLPESLEFRDPGGKCHYSPVEESRALTNHQLPSRLNERHITIVPKGACPTLQQCRKCCRLVHCPFCKESVYKPKNMYHVKRHIQIHLKSGVHYGDYIICRCNLECRKGAHFHCLWCSKTILRKEDFLNHLTVCQEKSCRFTHLLQQNAPFPGTSSYEFPPLPPTGGV